MNGATVAQSSRILGKAATKKGSAGRPLSCQIRGSTVCGEVFWDTCNILRKSRAAPGPSRLRPDLPGRTVLPPGINCRTSHDFTMGVMSANTRTHAHKIPPWNPPPPPRHPRLPPHAKSPTPTQDPSNPQTSPTPLHKEGNEWQLKGHSHANCNGSRSAQRGKAFRYNMCIAPRLRYPGRYLQQTISSMLDRFCKFIDEKLNNLVRRHKFPLPKLIEHKEHMLCVIVCVSC